jgi:transposase
MMRVMLYEAAQSMLFHSTKWSWLKAWAMKIARHRGMKMMSAFECKADNICSR